MPLFDWGPHPLGIISFLSPNFKILTASNISKDNRQKWFIRLTGDSINEVKILTGNGFKKEREKYMYWTQVIVNIILNLMICNI